MIIYGVAILATCSIAGLVVGELLGWLCGVKANVGGVGFSMLLLIAVTHWLKPDSKSGSTTVNGILFWSAMYVPIVVAMTATQNVSGAIQEGLVAVAAGGLAVFAGFVLVRFLGKSVPAELTSPGDSKQHEVGP